MKFPIIDSHHHIWKQSDLEWLQGEIQPRIFGDYTSIKQDYLIEDFLSDVLDFGVEKSVYIQCNWPIDKYLEEAKFIDDSFNKSGWPNAFIGYCNLLNPNAPEMLDRLFDYPLTRGIRMQLHWHERELYSFASSPSIMEERVFNNNFEYLAKRDSIFELQVFQSQLKHTKLLLNRFPETTFVLQHAGMPHDLSDSGRAEWEMFMESLIEHDNLFIKLSGLGTFINKNDPEFITDIVHKVLEIYPSDRCLFGSNFPIEKIWCNYGDLINAFLLAMSTLSIIDQKNIFYNTASKVYRI
tara:strand:- start:575 stop:1462 length:888 start_codon:yes stop_codon:yes gene_type:complete